MKHAIHFQCRRLRRRSTSGILHCICGLIKQNRKSLLRSFPAVYTISFAFCALERSLTNFFWQPSAPRHSRHFNIFQSQKLNINFPPNQLYNFSSFNSGGSMLIIIIIIKFKFIPRSFYKNIQLKYSNKIFKQTIFPG